MKSKKNRLSAKRRQPFLKITGACFIMLAILLTQVPVPNLDAAANDFRMDGTTLVKYSGTDTNVTIPGTVTSISSEAFADNTTMTSVTIPDSVTKIDMGAFSGCTGLKSVTIPDGVKEIGKSAFSGCTGLSSLTIGKGLSSLEASAFGGCTSLKDATISENNSDFYCTDGIIYDRGQTTVYQMLAGREKTDYTMPSTVTKINEYAFWDCVNLKKVSLSSSLTEIPAYSFSNCNGLESVDVPYSVKSIQMKAFENCEKLSDIEIPESVSFVHETAFDGCPLVKDKIKTTPLVTADNTDSNTSASSTNTTEASSDTKDSVSDNATENDTINSENGSNSDTSNDNAETTNPNQDTQPEEVTNTEETSSVEEQPKVVETPVQPQIDGMETKENPEVMGKTKIIGGQALVLIDAKHANVISDGISSNQVKNENDTSEDGTTLLKGSYYRNAELSSYHIANGITNIEDFAFARSGLTAIQIPDTVTSIGYAAFYHCDQLANVTIPDSVTQIGGEAFQKTPWMENWLNKDSEKDEDSTQETDTEEPVSEGEKENSDFLVVGDGILIAYRGTSPQVDIPENVKQIGPGTFKNHTEIERITFPDSLVRICDNAFDGCEKLASFEGGNNLSIIEEKAFDNCPIELETNVTTTTVQASRQNYVGNVGDYHILRKSVEKEPMFQVIKVGAVSISAFMGFLFISIAIYRHKNNRKSPA